MADYFSKEYELAKSPGMNLVIEVCPAVYIAIVHSGLQ